VIKGIWTLGARSDVHELCANAAEPPTKELGRRGCGRAAALERIADAVVKAPGRHNTLPAGFPADQVEIGAKRGYESQRLIDDRHQAADPRGATVVPQPVAADDADVG